MNDSIIIYYFNKIMSKIMNYAYLHMNKYYLRFESWKFYDLTPYVYTSAH